jgi:hypothetical protein
VTGFGETLRLVNEAEAFDVARERASTAARNSALVNGAQDPVLSVRQDIDAPEIEGQRKLVEARFTAVASGRPRLARA